MQQADDQFNSGVETLVRQSHAIVTGPLSHLSKRVLQSHAESETPLRWEIRGELDHPKVLKGNPALPVRFVRSEESLLLAPQDKEYWESSYLLWEPGDSAVVFFAHAVGSPEMRVYPSGSGDRDLATVVEHIVTAEANPDPARRFAAWSDAARSGAAVAEREAALRSLLAFGKPWNEISSVLRGVMQRPEIREFTFALIGYAIGNEQWSDPLPAAEFLCH